MVVALVAGDQRADLDAIAEHAGGRTPAWRTPRKSARATGYAIGGVCPSVCPPVFRCFADDSLLRFEDGLPGSGYAGLHGPDASAACCSSWPDPVVVRLLHGVSTDRQATPDRSSRTT